MGKVNKIPYIGFIIFTIQFTFCAQRGVVITPVADLVGEPCSSEAAYKQLPWAARGSDYAACPRIHQLLFHEIVEILEKRGEEIKVRVPNLFYQTTQTVIPQTEYWTCAKNIKKLSTIKKADRAKLPIPISFKRPMKTNRSIATLIAPYHDKKTGMTFSAGTRFLCCASTQRKAHVPVYRFNPKRGNCERIAIPKKQLYQANNKNEPHADLVKILQRWAHSRGTIPYVWGGCSFTETHKENTFSAVPSKKGGFYSRPEDKKRNPKTGFDCTGIVARAAQIVGLPYFLKNSYTMARNLPMLRPGEHLRPGDIIWIPGHVLVITNTKNNVVVEAHAYASGYGRVHELPIGNVFKGMKTFGDLENAFRKRVTLYRLSSKGAVFARYPEWKLLRIPT